MVAVEGENVEQQSIAIASGTGAPQFNDVVTSAEDFRNAFKTTPGSVMDAFPKYAEAGSRTSINDATALGPAAGNEIQNLAGRTITSQRNETPMDIARRMLPGASDQAITAYSLAMTFGNGLPVDGETAIKPGTRVRLPEMVDGKMTVERDGRRLEVHTDGAFRLTDKNNPNAGGGRDTFDRQYRFQTLPGGKELRTYGNDQYEMFNADKTSGYGKSSRGAYDFSINPDGSMSRTYRDTGAQEVVRPDGSSTYRGPSPDDPNKQVLALYGRDGELKFSQELTPEQANRPINQLLREQALRVGGDGRLDMHQTNQEAAVEVIRQAVADALSRGGDAAVQELANEIQARLRANFDPKSSFTLTPLGGLYDMVTDVWSSPTQRSKTSGYINPGEPRRFH